MSIQSFKHPVFARLAQYDFYLCSTSPRRKQILEQLGFRPTVVGSNFAEDLDKSKYTVKEYVRETATGKIMAVWEDLKKESKAGKAFLVAADTVVENAGRIYEKPNSYEENCRVLRELRDSKSPTQIISGVVLLVSDESRPEGYRRERFVESTGVRMKPDVSDEFIDEYCKTGEGLQVAGGFRIQGYGSTFITGMDGDFYNGVGLPAGRTFDAICNILGATI